MTWQRAMQLAEACYQVAAAIPIDERFGLGQQIRRASVSIPANIAEGHNGRTRQVFLNHLAIALGSQAELETQLELAHRLLAVDVERAFELTAEVGNLLHGLVWTLEHPTESERLSFTYTVRQ
ncbi:MAG: four helix bundle protein [Vicinamibacterales bacterium]